MSTICINRTRIRKIDFLNEFDISKINIWTPVTFEEACRIGLNGVGSIIMPSVEMGSFCKKNVYGYAYPDKTKDKERRTVASYYMHPYGNKNVEKLIDIDRDCYPKVEVAPYEIELQLLEDDKVGLYVAVVLDERIREHYVKEAINILLEIFGKCYICDDEIVIPKTKRRSVSWEILPPGVKPSDQIKALLGNNQTHNKTFIIRRLEFLERYDVDEIVMGINSFQGYHAFLIGEYCILESAIYGNATYIIKRECWENWSKLTKSELMKTVDYLVRTIHNSEWEKEMVKIFRQLGIKE